MASKPKRNVPLNSGGITSEAKDEISDVLLRSGEAAGWRWNYGVTTSHKFDQELTIQWIHMDTWFHLETINVTYKYPITFKFGQSCGKISKFFAQKSSLYLEQSAIVRLAAVIAWTTEAWVILCQRPPACCPSFLANWLRQPAEQPTAAGFFVELSWAVPGVAHWHRFPTGLWQLSRPSWRAEDGDSKATYSSYRISMDFWWNTLKLNKNRSKSWRKSWCTSVDDPNGYKNMPQTISSIGRKRQNQLFLFFFKLGKTFFWTKT